ncbi:RrF2 family transcriptional regulator [Candidatus Neomarinimicrobiota bacterium]
MIPSSVSHAIKILVYLAPGYPGQRVKLAQISTDTHIAKHAAIAATQALTKQHLLNTSRGSSGGIELAKSPDTINLTQVYCAVVGPDIHCDVQIEGRSCSIESNCPYHTTWEHELARMNAWLAENTLADVLKSDAQDLIAEYDEDL